MADQKIVKTDKRNLSTASQRLWADFLYQLLRKDFQDIVYDDIPQDIRNTNASDPNSVLRAIDIYRRNGTVDIEPLRPGLDYLQQSGFNLPSEKPPLEVEWLTDEESESVIQDLTGQKKQTAKKQNKIIDATKEIDASQKGDATYRTIDESAIVEAPESIVQPNVVVDNDEESLISDREVIEDIDRAEKISQDRKLAESRINRTVGSESRTYEEKAQIVRAEAIRLKEMGVDTRTVDEITKSALREARSASSRIATVVDVGSTETIQRYRPMTRTEISRRLDKIFSSSRADGDIFTRVDNLIDEARASGVPESVIGVEVSKRTEQEQSRYAGSRSKEAELRLTNARAMQAKLEGRARAGYVKRSTGREDDVIVQMQKVRDMVEEGKKVNVEPLNLRPDISSLSPTTNPMRAKVVMDAASAKIGQVVIVEQSRADPKQKSARNIVVDGSIFAPRNSLLKKGLEADLTRDIMVGELARATEGLLRQQTLPQSNISPNQLESALSDISSEIASMAVDSVFDANTAGKPDIRALDSERVIIASNISSSSEIRTYVSERLRAELLRQNPNLSAGAITKITNELSNSIISSAIQFVPAAYHKQTASLRQTEEGIIAVDTSRIIFQDGQAIMEDDSYIVDTETSDERIERNIKKYFPPPSNDPNKIRRELAEIENAKKITRSIVDYELNHLSTKPVNYALSLPFKAIRASLPSDKVKQYDELREQLAGGDTAKAKQISLMPMQHLSRIGRNQALTIAGIRGVRYQDVDGSNRWVEYNTFTDLGTRFAFRMFDGLGNVFENRYRRTLALRSASGTSRFGFRSNLNLSYMRRNALLSKKAKKRELGLAQYVFRMVIGNVVAASLDATTDVLRLSSTGRNLLARIEFLRSGGSGLTDAWRYGEGWASADFQGSSLKWTIGKMARGLNLASNVTKVVAGPVMKGAGVYLISAALGVPIPIAAAQAFAYGGYRALLNLANNPVLAMHYDEATKALRLGTLMQRSGLFSELAYGLNTRVPAEVLNAAQGVSRVARVANLVSRYMPAEGLFIAQWLTLLGVPLPVSMAVGVGGQYGIRALQAFVQGGTAQTIARGLGILASRLNAIGQVLGGFMALAESGGIVNMIGDFFRNGFTLHNVLRLAGVGMMFAGLGALLGGPLALAIGGGLLIFDQVSQWLGGPSLWDMTGGLVIDKIGPQVVAIAGAAFGFINGFFKLLTARNLSELADAIILTTFGLFMSLGLLTFAATSSTLYMPTVPGLSDTLVSSSIYFKDVSKTLSSIDNSTGKTLLNYKMTYNFTGGSLADKDMIGVMITDRITGIPSDKIDPTCSGIKNYPHMQFFPDDGSGRPIFIDLGPGINIPPSAMGSPSDLIGADNINMMRHLGSSDIGNLVSLDFTVCLKDDISNIIGSTGTFTNIFTISGIPVAPVAYGAETLPSNWESAVESASAIDTRNSKGESPLFQNPIDPGVSRITKIDHYTGGGRLYFATDFGADAGTPVYAVADGIVSYASWNSAGYGNFIIVDHSNGYQSAYAHLSAYASGLSKGTGVKAGEIIGSVGSSGNSTGPHLHFEIRVDGRRQKPCNYINCNLYTIDLE